MNTLVEYAGRQININISRQAQKQLERRTEPLYVEMELYFSCLIRKKVRFDRQHPADFGMAISEKLFLRFHPIMTESCSMDLKGDKPPTTDFPIAKLEPYIPHWLNIDFRRGQWQGEFGYR